MEVYEAILTRRSVRTYDTRPVSPEIIKKIAGAGMCSPSARNNRPWEFIAITDRSILSRLSKVRPFWAMLNGAGAAIVVVNDNRTYTSPTTAFSVQDCAAATENILLAAHGEGLGAVWLGLYPLKEEQDMVRDILEIPANIIPFSIISLGYPAVRVKGKDCFEEEKLHWNSYRGLL